MLFDHTLFSIASVAAPWVFWYCCRHNQDRKIPSGVSWSYSSSAVAPSTTRDDIRPVNVRAGELLASSNHLITRYQNIKGQGDKDGTWILSIQ